MTTIYVLCPDYDAPSGGIRKLYRHVDVLNASGFDAILLHTQPGFRCRWFANDTRVRSVPDVQPGFSDVIVLPEVYGPDLAMLFPGVRKVIFNQNAYLTFTGYTVDPLDLRSPYQHPEVIAVLSISEDNHDYLTYAFPRARHVRLHYGIDHQLFRSASTKRNQIAYMPRKNAADVVQVINLLKHRHSLRGFSLVPIDGKSEAEVADILAESAIFLSFGHPEGCPLPPLEAMAAGCVVVGYHGQGGREYFRPSFSRPVHVGEIIRMSQDVEAMIDLFTVDPARGKVMGEAAAAFVRERYSWEREERDIVAFWTEMLNAR